MLKLIASILLITSLASCSWKDVASLIIPSKSGGINTELVVGDKKQEVNTAIGNQKANTIVNKTEAPPWLMILAAVGWFLPSPQGLLRMWRTRNVKP